MATVPGDPSHHRGGDRVSRLPPSRIESAPDAVDANVTGICQFVFPQPDHGPAAIPQQSIYEAVTTPVRRELLSPKAGVGRGHLAVLGTAVPKTPIDKYHDSASREEKIRTSRELAQRLGRPAWCTEDKPAMSSPAGNVAPTKQRHQHQLCGVIALAPDSGHYLAAFLLREDVSHDCVRQLQSHDRECATR